MSMSTATGPRTGGNHARMRGNAEVTIRQRKGLLVTLFASLGRVFGGARRGFGVPSMHRPLALLTAVLVLALLGGSASGRSVRRLAPVGQNAVFVVTGHGWGHGVGMSQYGAYGYAQHGFPYTKIVVHYFPGTTLGPAPVSKVRVLLGSGQS